MTLAGPFVAVIPEQVRELGLEAATVLAHLSYLTADGPAVATAAALADGTGLSTRTVQRATSKLRDRGLVTSERESTWNPTQRWTVSVSAGGAVSANVARTLPPVVAVSQPADVAVTPLGLELEESPLQGPPEVQGTLPLLSVVASAASKPPGYDAEFTRFWELWPSGRKTGKPDALRAYTAARKRGVPVDAIASGLRAHLPAMVARVAAGEGQFVPHPATWLRQERWNDPAPPMPRGEWVNPFASTVVGQ